MGTPVISQSVLQLLRISWVARKHPSFGLYCASHVAVTFDMWRIGIVTMAMGLHRSWTQSHREVAKEFKETLG
jgi:hypothetical protein